MAKSSAAPAVAGHTKPDTKEKNTLPRLSIPLTADKSRLAVENMTDPVKDRLRAVLADPELRARLALPADTPAAVPVVQTWDGEFTGLLWEVVGRLGVMLAAQGFTPVESELLLFTEQEKEKLAGPTAAVLDKYLPGGLDRYGPEIVLAITVSAMLQGKVLALRRVASERLAAAPTANTVITFPSAAPAPAS